MYVIIHLLKDCFMYSIKHLICETSLFCIMTYRQIVTHIKPNTISTSYSPNHVEYGSQRCCPLKRYGSILALYKIFIHTYKFLRIIFLIRLPPHAFNLELTEAMVTTLGYCFQKIGNRVKYCSLSSSVLCIISRMVKSSFPAPNSPIAAAAAAIICLVILLTVVAVHCLARFRIYHIIGLRMNTGSVTDR